MRQLLMASVASLALVLTGPVFAQTSQGSTTTNGGGMAGQTDLDGGNGAVQGAGNESAGPAVIDSNTPAVGLSGALDRMYLQQRARAEEGAGASQMGSGTGNVSGENAAGQRAGVTANAKDTGSTGTAGDHAAGGTAATNDTGTKGTANANDTGTAATGGNKAGGETANANNPASATTGTNGAGAGTENKTGSEAKSGNQAASGTGNASETGTGSTGSTSGSASSSGAGGTSSGSGTNSGAANAK
jgi:hypothetical protein